jgi:hypothetical protein
MRIVANSIPKSGTNLLGRLLTLLGFEQTSEMGIRSRLVAGPFAPARKLLRARSAEKVTIGVVSPQRIDRQWLERRLSLPSLPESKCASYASCVTRAMWPSPRCTTSSRERNTLPTMRS